MQCQRIGSFVQFNGMEVKMDLGFLQLLYNIKGSSKEISLSISYI